MPITLDGTAGITNDATDLNYTGTLTGGTGVINIGSGQLYKDASGNVGIGTSSPAVSGLEISRDTGAASPTPAELRISTINNASNWSTSLPWGRLSYYSADGSTGGAKIHAAIDTVKTGSAGGVSNLTFSLAEGSAGVLTERMRIDSSGSLLVGTTATGIFSSSTATGHVFDSNGVATHSSNSNVLLLNRTQTNGAAVVFHRAGSNVGNINVTTTATAYVTSSDYRLKHDIQPMTGALAKVAQLKPVTYRWNADDSDGEGFIAHELQEVVPECVTGEKDAVDAEGKPVYQGIDTSFLVATLTAAIQEQQAIIEQLKADVAALKGAQA